MGEPADFEGANHIMHAPKGQEESVTDLPVYLHESGMVFAVQLDEHERAKVAETGVVWVQIMSHRMPPIAVGAEGLKMLNPDGTERDAKVQRVVKNQKRV